MRRHVHLTASDEPHTAYPKPCCNQTFVVLYTQLMILIRLNANGVTHVGCISAVLEMPVSHCTLYRFGNCSYAIAMRVSFESALSQPSSTFFPKETQILVNGCQNDGSSHNVVWHRGFILLHRLYTLTHK